MLSPTPWIASDNLVGDRHNRQIAHCPSDEDAVVMAAAPRAVRLLQDMLEVWEKTRTDSEFTAEFAATILDDARALLTEVGPALSMEAEPPLGDQPDDRCTGCGEARFGVELDHQNLCSSCRR